MNCKFPPEIEDQKLLAYLDDEVDHETRLHLEQCPYCLERAKKLAHVHNRLTARLYRLACLSSLELGEYYLRMLPASQMLIVSQHLRECPHCAREVSALQSYLGELTPTEEAGMLDGIKVLVARWIGGNSENTSSMSPVPSALRGEGKGPITLEADGIVIILDIQATSEGRVAILGQVAADDQDRWTNSMVELHQADVPPMTAYLDDLGAFRFEEAHIGSTEIIITSPDGIIVQIPNFDLTI